MYPDRGHKAQIVLHVLAGYAGEIDGDLGPVTLAAAEAVPGSTVRWGSAERRALAGAQRALVRAGFDPGPVDGFWGPQTDFAYLDWRAANDAAATPLPHRGPPDLGREGALVARYGPAGGPRCTAGRVRVPWRMVLAWDEAVQIGEIACHEEIAPAVQRIFEAVADYYGAAAIRDLGLNLYGGCYNFRRKRGGSAWSMHAWGLAFDFDPGRNRLPWGADRARLAQPDAAPWWATWEAEGFTSLGRARNFDWMHVQAPRP